MKKAVFESLALAVFLLSLGFLEVSQASSANQATVPIHQFRSQFEKGMVEGFCHETKFTQECYDLNVGTCEANVKSSVAKCMRENPAGKEVPQNKVSAYSVTLGRCVGVDFNERNKSRLRKISECKNPLEWLGR